MKLLLTALCFFFTTAPLPLMVIDKDFKNRVKTAAAFTTQDFMQHTFPIYASDKEAIIAAADKAARLIEQAELCYTIDSIHTPNSFFVVSTECSRGMAVSVRLFTRLDETATTYCFKLIQNEPSKRKAQQRLMDFATYINR